MMIILNWVMNELGHTAVLALTQREEGACMRSNQAADAYQRHLMHSAPYFHDTAKVPDGCVLVSRDKVWRVMGGGGGRELRERWRQEFQG